MGSSLPVAEVCINHEPRCFKKPACVLKSKQENPQENPREKPEENPKVMKVRITEWTGIEHV